MGSVLAQINPALLGVLIILVLGLIGFTVWWDERRKR